MKCCGVYNYSDWFKSAAWPDNDYVPLECCVTNVTNCNTQHQPILWHKKVGHKCCHVLMWCNDAMVSLSDKMSGGQDFLTPVVIRLLVFAVEIMTLGMLFTHVPC